ncbi:hypothetical protein KBB96_14525 [Luteolibacter ambystomatis]|uniref:Uncharacterized protein n=1 Tax=Luteolibacter ambystomatis TaxID=2824561 RepID=A0A975G779_9BACT|nr:hypothetical protein [Luteolibacter ambystomatis]QUE50078.1 hypothetical protein KBB96_14525 [Luteolibacter ambystomatis]
MKALVPLLCLAGGIAVGWFARPMAASSTAASAPPVPAATAPANSAPAPEKPAGSETAANGRTSSGRPAKPDNDESKAKRDAKAKEAMKKGQDQMAKRMTDVQRKKFEARLDKLAADLNLNDDQKAKIRAAMEKRFETFGSLLTRDDDDTNDLAHMKEIGELMKSDGLDTATEGVLTDEQKEQYTAFKGKERQSRIESKAFKDLGNITNVLDLSPEQRDNVYQVLMTEAATREDNQKASGNMMSLFSDGLGFQFDDELGVQDLMQEQMEAQMQQQGGGKTSMADIRKNFQATVKQRTDAKVEALRPYLSEPQLQQYRSHLETKGGGLLNMFGGAGDDDAGN